MSNIDDTRKNKQSIPDKISDGRTDINMLLKALNDVNNRLDIIERALNAKKQVVNWHTSEMPDYKGDNRDHDARYATKKDLRSIPIVTIPEHNDLDGLQGGSATERYHLTNEQVESLHDQVTVEDTDTVDISISGQQISAETIGLTDTITFVE